MKKQTKVLLAAALFTLGASFSSMAALKNGTWVLNEEGWQYANKEGDYESEVWAMSYGTEYWLNEDAVLGASEWVEEDGHVYYVQSDGSKTKNAWKYLYDMEDDDEEGDQYWYYFDAKGRMVDSEAKYQVGDYYYYFNDKGQMLTGWVNKTELESAEGTNANIDDVVYTNEDGQLVKSSWISMYPWTMTEDEAYDDDYEYFYAKSSGALAKTKEKIDGLHYFFNNETGVMMTGWIKKVDGVYTGANAIVAGDEAYWTDDEIGYAKKNQWLELEPADEGDDAWFWFDKNGKVFAPTATDSNVAAVDFVDGESNNLDPDTVFDAKSKKFGDTYYYFKGDGEMVDGLVTIDGQLNYLVDGARQTGKVTLEDNDLDVYTFCFASKTEDDYIKYAAVNGNYDGYLYNQGQLITAIDDYAVKEVNGKYYIVDVNGAIQHSKTKEYTLDEAFNGKNTFKAKDANYEFSKADGSAKYSLKVVTTAE